jgi:hydroxymethylglutaryl-CoA lyase
MIREVSIVEVGARDGLQSEATHLSTETKIDLIGRLVACGVRRLEVASFVNPKRVPQMADAEAVIAGLPDRDDVSYIGLVLNRRGFERALAAGVDEIGMVVIASETFNTRNQGAGIAESIAVWREIAPQARAAGIRAGITISAAFGCPFEGEVPEARVIEIAEQVLTAQPDEIAIADTIGVGVPAQVESIISAIHDLAPDMPLRCHFHNTRNTGLANAFSAVRSGASCLDASIGGMGGCPFAPGAAGNIPTEDLVYMLHRSGITTGISLERLVETSHWLVNQLGHELPALLPRAGIFPASLNAPAGG